MEEKGRKLTGVNSLNKNRAITDGNSPCTRSAMEAAPQHLIMVSSGSALGGREFTVTELTCLSYYHVS